MSPDSLYTFLAPLNIINCHDVAIEPVLQPLSGESFHYAMANVEDEARLDVSVQGICGNCLQRAFFDVRVFNPTAQI